MAAEAPKVETKPAEMAKPAPSPAPIIPPAVVAKVVDIIQTAKATESVFPKEETKTEIKSETPAPIPQTNLADEFKNGLHIRTEISTTTFIAYVLGLLGFMYTLSIAIGSWDFTGYQYILIGWAIFWMIMAVMGFEKGSIFKFVVFVARMMYDPKMSADAKVAFIYDQMMKLYGFAKIMESQLNLGADTPKSGLTKIWKFGK